MKIEIKVINNLTRKYPVLQAYLYTESNDYYANGGDKGIYKCEHLIPNENEITRVNYPFNYIGSLYENAVNICLEKYEKDIEKTLKSDLDSFRQPGKTFKQMIDEFY